MLTKEITWTDFNGEKRTHPYYFNLTKAEMIEYDASFPEGAMEYLTNLVKTQQKGKLVLAFKDLILRSYGEKTDNGRFVKSQEIREAFAASEAYSELFMEITSSEEAAAAFINGIVPVVPDPNANRPAPVVPIKPLG